MGSDPIIAQLRREAILDMVRVHFALTEPDPVSAWILALVDADLGAPVQQWSAWHRDCRCGAMEAQDCSCGAVSGTVEVALVAKPAGNGVDSFAREVERFEARMETDTPPRDAGERGGAGAADAGFCRQALPRLPA